MFSLFFKDFIINVVRVALVSEITPASSVKFYSTPLSAACALTVCLTPPPPHLQPQRKGETDKTPSS